MDHGRRYGLVVLVVAMLMLAGLNVTAQRVRLRGELTPPCSSSQGPDLRFADIYGDGNIAVQGSYGCKGAFIYDISNPDAPVLASWYNPGGNLQFLEAIVIGNRGYFGSGNGGGVHIVDLTNPYSPVLLGTVTSAVSAYNSIHEMVVFQQNGATILVENFNSLSPPPTLKFINVTNPAAPVFLRNLTGTEPRWIHAMHIRGDRMFTSGWGNGSSARGRTEIYDISNVATQTPTLLGFVQDPSSNFDAGNQMHSAWTSEDGNYLYSCREVTNSNGPTPGDVRVYDIHDPANPLLVNSLTMAGLGLNAVTPHNPVVMGNLLYVSWYQAGIQVFDISDPANPVRVGQYDTYQPTYVEPPPGKVDADGPWDMMCGTAGVQNSLPTDYDGAWAVFPFLGQDKVLAGDLASGLWILDASHVQGPQRNKVSDFDGDSRTDLSVFSPSTGDWTVRSSSSGRSTTVHWGQQGDVLVAGDYDGDGLSDIAIWRPSTGWWHVKLSGGSEINVPFGASTDVPVPGDYDADGRTDLAVWRPSTGIWYILQSSLGFRAVQWGISTDKPVIGDYDSDGRSDVAVWRPSNGVWYILQSTSTRPMYRQFGMVGDEPLFADFDGNGTSDIAVYRPSDGSWYYMDQSGQGFHALSFGVAEDIPVPADYDGDGDVDVAVYRPSTNIWYRLDSSTGTFWAEPFGASGDIPAPTSVQPH